MIFLRLVHCSPSNAKIPETSSLPTGCGGGFWKVLCFKKISLISSGSIMFTTGFGPNHTKLFLPAFLVANVGINVRKDSKDLGSYGGKFKAL